MCVQDRGVLARGPEVLVKPHLAFHPHIAHRRLGQLSDQRRDHLGGVTDQQHVHAAFEEREIEIRSQVVDHLLHEQDRPVTRSEDDVVDDRAGVRLEHLDQLVAAGMRSPGYH
jgi:hypothetical protein